MPVLAVVVGLPCSGKTTFIKEQFSNYVTLSRDSYIDDRAKALGVGYLEAWNSLSKEQHADLDQRFEDEFRDAVIGGYDIVLDRTSLTVASRKRWLDIAANHSKVAVFIPTSVNVCLDRNMKRRAEHGKFVPDHVIREMYEGMEIPTEAEGFEKCRLATG